MCGIVGGVTRNNNIVDFLISGLRALEYRGYDSAGIAVQQDGAITRMRRVGRVAALEEATAELEGAALSCGIGHTRWATHGVPSERNAHPHLSECAARDVAVVHNGIIENHDPLRQKLQARGYAFTSDTDTEVIAHLMHWHLEQGLDLTAALRATRAELHGLFAVAVTDSEHPGVVVATRQGAPLLVGIAPDGHYLASDVSALLSRTRQVVYLQEGDLVALSVESLAIEDAHGAVVARPVVTSAISEEAVQLGAFQHFMQKEIFEQPEVLIDTMDDAFAEETYRGNIFAKGERQALVGVEEVLILACGTSFNAASVARHWFEGIAGVPCTVEIASEFRYRTPVLRPHTMVVTVSQSGETADTKAAVEFAVQRGASPSLSVCNVPESALVRLSDLVLMTHAGPEIGVASTKAFTTQLVTLYLLALAMWQAREGHRSEVKAAIAQKLTDLKSLPRLVQSALSMELGICKWAQLLAPKQSAMFLGRGALHPIAQEGSLKLKEVTYIHAEAYSTGELKHGPLALIDEHMPVVVSVANDDLLDKVKANLQEVRARKGELFVIADKGCGILHEEGVHVLEIPEMVPADLAPIVQVVPLQLLAYHAALAKGTDVDKPRNLAKSVTVE